MKSSKHESANQQSSTAQFSNPKIDRIDIAILDIVPARQRRIPSGKIPYGGPGSVVGRPVLVRVWSQGVNGVGEIRPINPFVGESASSMYPVLRDFYAPKLIGRSVFAIEEALNQCEKSMPGHPSALAVLDMALHDLIGKILNVPVHALLGGACRETIGLEWSVGLSTDDEMIREAGEAVEKFGVGCVCIKVGPRERLDTDVHVMQSVRKIVGDDVTLGMDANTTYSANGAISLVRLLTDSRIGYFEQPVRRTSLNEMRRIRDAVDCSIFADESLFTRHDALRIIEAGAADVLGLKFYKCAGLHRMREIAAIADAGNLEVNCAGTTAGTYIEAIAAAHLCASIPNHAFGAEFIMGLPSVNGHDPIVANQPIDVKNGACDVPMAPGLGVVIDESQLKKLSIAFSSATAAGVKESA